MPDTTYAHDHEGWADMEEAAANCPACLAEAGNQEAAEIAARFLPAEHDARQYEVMQQNARAEAQLWALRDKMHAMAGDKRERAGRGYQWAMSWGEVGITLSAMARDGDADDFRHGGRPSQLLAQDSELIARITELDAREEALEAAWKAGKWTRYYPCLNRDGHVHRSLRGCESVYADTQMGWDTSLSGMTVEQAIAKLGPRLCSKCFPDAPSEWCRSLADINREQNAAGKAAKAAKAAGKAAADAVKLLADGERFTSRRDGDRITKVTELKGLIRKAVEDHVELEWLNGVKGAPKDGWSEEFLARRRVNQAQYALEAGEDAAQAERILLAREAAHPGWGLTAGDIARMRASKERSERRGYEI